MRCGYFTMPLTSPSNPSQTMADDLEQLVTLEPLGFEEAWIGEHFTSVWENIPCPDLFIAQALAVTRTMKLGTGVSCLPNHHPLMLAQRIAQLDHMARGRLYWGVGSGGFPGDFELFGIDAQGGEQRRVTREVLDVVLDLWNDPKPGVYKSKHWEFRVPAPQDDIGLGLHLRPYQRPHPPIGVAGLSPKSETLVMAGERGYIPMSINIVPPRILTSTGRWSNRRRRRSVAPRIAGPGASRGTCTSPRRAPGRDARFWKARLPETGGNTSSRCSGRPGCSRSPRSIPRCLTTGSRPSTSSTTSGSSATPIRSPTSSRRSSARLAASEGSWSSATSGSRASRG